MEVLSAILSLLAAFWVWTLVGFVVVVLVLPSIRIIGPTEVGLVTRRFSFRKFPGHQMNAVAAPPYRSPVPAR